MIVARDDRAEVMTTVTRMIASAIGMMTGTVTMMIGGETGTMIVMTAMMIVTMTAGPTPAASFGGWIEPIM